MNKNLSCILFISIGLFLLAPKVNAQTDFEKIITNVNAEIKKGFSASTTAINGSITTLMNDMNPNGTWNDLSYVNGINGDVPFVTHLSRLRTMAIAYTFSGATYYSSSVLYNKILLGLQYWNANIHDADNWYQDQIGYPQLLGEMLIVMRSATTQLPTVDENNVINYLSTRDNPSLQTGANRVDESVHWVYRGALTNNASVINIGVTQAQSTLAIVNSGGEGINADFSFLQHSSQLMIQGYGKEFLDGIYNVAVYIKGTSFSFDSVLLGNAYKFLRHSYCGAARGPYKDFNLDGRGISRLNSNKGISANVVAKAMAVDPANAATLRSDSLRITQQQPASYNVSQPYHLHYWVGDYTLHNRPSYSFAVRTVSTRTIRTETLNGENKLGTWLSNGATSIRVDGGEYYNIFPVWDWNKIPGITMRQFATPQTNTNSPSSYGNTSFVGGVSDSTYGASTFKQNSGGVTATKSWFFFDNEIVCLGTGINGSFSDNIATTVNQALLSGAVSTKAAGVTTTMTAASQQDFIGDLSWVLHNKVGYFFPAGGNVSVSNQTQTGNWATIGTASGAVSTDVFKLWFNHGAGSSNPNASYAYIVAPGITTTAQMDTYNSSAIQILSNTTVLQAVKHSTLNIVEVIFSTAGTLTLTGTELTSITVDKPCAIIIKNINTSNPGISIADPSQSSGAINLTLTYQTAPQENIFCAMPTGNYKGSSKTISASSAASSFTPGFIAVLRMGGLNGTNGTTGSSSPGTAGTPLHIDKYAVTGPGTFTYINSIDLPVASTNNIFASSSTNEGYLSQSANKQWISVMGYATKSASGTIYSTTANPNIPRTLGLIKYDGSVDLTTALSNFPASGTAATAQTAITNNGTGLWCATNQGVTPMGVLYTTLGATDANAAPSIIVTTTTPAPVNSVKSLSIFGGDLYYTANSGNRIGTVSATGGLPTTVGASAMTALPVATGSTAFSAFTPSQNVLFDLDSSILGYDVMYVTNASSTAGQSGIYKYCKNAAGQWVSFGTFGAITGATDGFYFGITGNVVDGLPVLYVTRGISATQNLATNQLIQLKESAGYNATMSATIGATTDATVSGMSGTIRGVAFFPTPTYYYKGTGNLNVLTSWGENIDGTGTAPANFTDSSQTFFITNGSSSTLSANLTVSGYNSKIILGDGTNATSLTIPPTFSINADMDVYHNAVLNIQHVQAPKLRYVALRSTINYAGAALQNVATIAYGNFNNTNSSEANLNGTVTVAGTITQSGILKGDATLIAPNGFNNTGTLKPGYYLGSFTVTGNFTNSPASTLEIQLGGNATAGNDYDQLIISGTATVGGTLNIALANSFIPQIGETYTIVTATAITGTFATVNWPTGVTGTVNYTATTVELTITGNTVPLQLLSFTGSVLQNGKNQLQWNTANEDNVDFFIVERSNNGNGYSTITRQTAIGHGNNNYTIVDESPFAKINYYRLKMMDKNGHYTYSSIIRLKNNSNSGFSMFPNPAKNNLIVTHPIVPAESFIQIIQLDGKVVFKQNISIGAVQTSIDISTLHQGLYLVYVYSDKEVTSFKLIKE